MIAYQRWPAALGISGKSDKISDKVLMVEVETSGSGNFFLVISSYFTKLFQH